MSAHCDVCGDDLYLSSKGGFYCRGCELEKKLASQSAALRRAEEALEMALENIDISEYGEQVEIKSALAEIRSIKAGKP